MTEGRALSAYQAVISGAGVIVLILFTIFIPIEHIFSVVFFTVLAVVAETQTVYLGSEKSVSVSSAVIILAMLTEGPTAAVWAAAASVCGSVTKVDAKRVYHIFNSPFMLTLFNIGSYVLSVAVMCMVYFHLGGRLITSRNLMTLFLQAFNRDALELIAAILTSFLANSLLINVFLLLRRDVGGPREFLSALVSPAVNLFVVCLLGIVLTAIYVVYGWLCVVLFFIPFMLARYVFLTYNDMRKSYLQTVKSLTTAIEAKDEYTSGHSRRVAEYSVMIASQMKLSAKRCENLRYAALLHDVGKIGIPESILNKPGKLNETEWELIRQHPEKGAHIIEDIVFLTDAAEIIRSHHEWYNGSGYPDGKNAQSLSMEAMILCVADCYDAMTSQRPYRRQMTPQEAMQELEDKSGTQFNGEIVQAFKKALIRSGSLML